MRTAARWARAIRRLDPDAHAGQLRHERLERLGPGGHRRPGPPGRPALAAHLHRLGRLLGQRAGPAPGRAGHPVRRRAHRPGRLHQEDRPAAGDRLRRVERLVPHRRRHAGGAVQLLRRPGGRHLPEHLRPQLPAGPDGQSGPDGQRDRADRDQHGAAVATQPIYYPVLLHAQAALDVAVDVHVDGPTVDGPRQRAARPVAAPGRPTWARSPWSTRRPPPRPSAGRIAVTLVNRGLEAEPAEIACAIVLRDAVFDGRRRDHDRHRRARARRPRPARRRGGVP